MLRPLVPIKSDVPWLAKKQELHDDNEPWRRDEFTHNGRKPTNPMAALRTWHPLMVYNSSSSSLLDLLMVARY